MDDTIVKALQGRVVSVTACLLIGFGCTTCEKDACVPHDSPIVTAMTYNVRVGLGDENQGWYVLPEGHLGKEDAVSDDTAEIQSRIDAAWRNGGGEVLVGPGEHLVRPMRLRSNVTLRLKAGARLRASRRIEDYLVPLADDPLEPVAPAALKAVPGENLTARSQSALFRAFGTSGCALAGRTRHHGHHLRECPRVRAFPPGRRRRQGG